MPKAKSKNKTLITPAIKYNDKKILPSNGLVDPTYEEQQNDEVEVLRSIFPEDFEDIETKTAWSKRAERSFRLKLVADSDSTLYVILTVTFTATYPRTAPLLSSQCSKSVPDKTREKVQYAIDTRPKTLLGEVMILELSNEIRDVLEDAAQALAAGSAVPSLEQERAKQEIEAERAAREEEERESERIEQEKVEEERAMQRLVEEEIKRRDAQRQKLQSQEPQLTSDIEGAELIFDQPLQVTRLDGVVLHFQAVQLVKVLASASNVKQMEVRPLIGNVSQDANFPCMILKRIKIRQQQANKSLLDLEDDLERLTTLRHDNVVRTLAFKMSRCSDSEWQFDILVESSDGISIDNLLDVVESLSTNKVRGFATQILQAMEYLHKNGITHGALRGENVLVCDSGGSKIIKLANICLEGRLHDIAEHDNKAQGSDSAATLPWNWLPPECLSESAIELRTRKMDIWLFAVVIAQMLLGLDVVHKQQPQSLLTDSSLSRPLRDLLRDALRSDPHKRPSAFDLMPYEFLRTDCPAFEDFNIPKTPRTAVRRQSSNYQPLEADTLTQLSMSRFASEWFELGRLGKGGFGEVVKARNKLDGRSYAIKKITNKTQAELTKVLSEVFLLATLNHPYVVRYFGAWPEEERGQVVANTGTDTPATPSLDTMQSSSDFALNEHLSRGPSIGGLDFISSSGYPKIEFGDSDEDEDGDDSGAELDDDSSDNGPSGPEGASIKECDRASPNVSRTPVRTKATLYIQMELCDKLTLRDMIRRGLQDNIDETWRLLRQVLEGLVHIHSHDIIHRDLKPENIFIDLGNNVKIGDFGLATTGQSRATQEHSESTPSRGGEMTLSVGTALYVAPEVQSSGGGHYSEKIDMYSLGIIFFEMCHALPTAMERVRVLTELRQKDHVIPDTFESAYKQAQKDVILSLVKHRPSERPSSTELLRSGQIPVKIEDEQVRQTLFKLSDPTSPYFSRTLEALFLGSSNSMVQARLWDQSKEALVSVDATDFAAMQSLVKDRMTRLFRRYGALESFRQGLFPRSEYYLATECACFLDASGTPVQLPYDLILPHARAVANQSNFFARSFAFGSVFRAAPVGGAPRSNREADLDIISQKGEDTTLAEAEVIKCLDDLLQEFPCFNNTPMCFHLSHSGLLDAILEFTRVPRSQQAAVKDVLGKLHIGTWTWQKIRGELRTPAMGINASVVDDLSQFDFRDTPEKAFKKLQTMFRDTPHLQTLETVFTHLSGLNEYLKRFGVCRKVYVSPLSSLNDKFYRSSVMFQCLFDTKKRDIFAAGGRYDSLIENLSMQQHKSSVSGPRAVGANIAWYRLVTSMLRMQRQSGTNYLKKPDVPPNLEQWALRRSEVLIASFDPAVLRSTGIKLVSELRTNDISAELAIDSRSTDKLLAHYRHDKHSWIVIIKHEGFSNGKPDLKVRPMDSKGEAVDVQSTELVSYIKSELREREDRVGPTERGKLYRNASHTDGLADNGKSDVHVLIAQHKTKKTNKARIIEDAQARMKELLASYTGGPIAAVETRDEVLEKIRDTKLSDPDTWRKVIQGVPLPERQYCHDLLDLIESLKSQYGDSTRRCFIYNFRTGYCIDYDLLI